ncbi:hypothetical protein BDZ88DRAFT_410451 [Geranomyces variabilis]|nr:hypothetical protein BDZ88DRAFT_410451 [Geranomyces variabilis]
MPRVSLLAVVILLLTAVLVGSRPTAQRPQPVKGPAHNEPPSRPATVTVNLAPTKTSTSSSPDSVSSDGSLLGQPCDPVTDVWACRGNSFLACTFTQREWIAQENCTVPCLDDPAVRPLCFRNSNGTTAVASQTATATIGAPIGAFTMAAGLVVPIHG